MFTAVAALSVAYPASVQAVPTTYQYTGNPFTVTAGIYTGSDFFVTVTIALAGNPPMSTNAHRTLRHPLLGKLVSAHRTAAGVLFNALFLFVAVNLALWAAYTWHDHRPEAKPLFARPKEWLAVSFPGWSHADLEAMVDEQMAKGYAYDDYIMFKLRPMRGRYLNVSENGFRVSRAQGPWPPVPTNFNVFVFGSSNMFGTWLPDEKTVPSFLQVSLARRLATNVCVYNFGTPYYYSTQERLRFERLLGQGIVPHAAVFVDGCSDLHQLEDTPAGRERFVEAFEVANKNKSLLPALVQELPLARLIRSITARVRVPVRHDPITLPAKAARVIATYRENKLMIESLCAAHGVAPVFVWQPIPCYNYDLKYFPWYHHEKAYRDELKAVGYTEMRALYDRGALGTNFLWCADLQADEHECLYVDFYHYTAKFSEKFGEAIAALSLERGLLPNVAQRDGRSEERRLNQFKQVTQLY
jgi:hypothetical protein